MHDRHKLNASPKTLLNYKTALKWVVNSSFHFVLDSVLISRYITGVFNLFPKPPCPQRDVWDVNKVLNYWDRQPVNKDLPLMMLTQKTVLLLLISTMRRRSELLSMNLDTVVYYPNSMVFPLEAYPKTYSLMNSLESLRFITIRKFLDNPNLCPVLALQGYIKKTPLIRTTRKVFITCQSPFRAIANFTLRRWILTALNDAGIDVMKYTVSSTRHASSSKAYYAGVSVDAVMLRAGWTNVSSFVTHYHLPVISADRSSSFNTRKSLRGLAAVSKKATTTPTHLFSPVHHRLATAKNIRAMQLLNNAHKSSVKKILFASDPFASPPPAVPRVVLPALIPIIVNRSFIRKGRGKIAHRLTKIPQRVMVSTLPADDPSLKKISKRIRKKSSTPVVPVFKNLAEHDDSDTE